MTIKADDILAVVTAVTKEWTRQRKAEEKGSKSRASRAYIYSDRVNFTDVAATILPGAYRHASGGGRYTVSKRNFFYACRDQFKEMTGRELEYKYFAGSLLVQYMNRHPETAAWKVTADPRGNLTIPNAGHDVRIPCGTIQIDNYLREAGQAVELLDIDAEVSIEWPSLAPGQRYQAVLYIEKEGFEPMLAEARIAERFDVAIVSCKGQSVAAARRLADMVCAKGNGVPLLVVHDLDKSGFEIALRLTTVSGWAEENDRVIYRFQNDIDFIDLGLRLEDVKKYGLTGEACSFSGTFDPESIATEEEKRFLRSGRRVEINELTAPQFLEWLEGKLREHLPERLIPADRTLEAAYRRAVAVARINRAIEEIYEDAIEEAEKADIPVDLRARLREALSDPERAVAWDRALYRIASEDLDLEDERHDSE
jgi:hypothetical protein